MLKASLFLISFDGTYLGYYEAGHPGDTIVPYNRMIGRKAMDELPEPVGQTVKEHHQRAIATGEPQEYFYTSPLTGRQMKSYAVPYPTNQTVALFVMEATEVPAAIPA
ncbi:hypothetical protein IQ267_28465 [filamentous cyanobacterium LEGE 07170]|nr:hypothetical protein [filamentous cyanobacterium LEGE 07170]